MGSGGNIFLISAGGGPLEQVTFGTIADLDPTWSPYMAWSRDSKYVSFDTGDVTEPFFYRFHVADSRLERVVSLKDTPRFYGNWGPWTGLAPDGSPLFVRDISNQEIYALDWQLP
jgi:hypothetical protein